MTLSINGFVGRPPASYSSSATSSTLVRFGGGGSMSDTAAGSFSSWVNEISPSSFVELVGVYEFAGLFDGDFGSFGCYGACFYAN